MPPASPGRVVPRQYRPGGRLAWPPRRPGSITKGPAAAAVNAVAGGAAAVLTAVTDGGRLASIAGAVPADPGRGIQARTVFIQPGAAQLRRATALLADGHLRLSIAAEYPLAEAADALSQVLAGTGGGAVALRAGDG